MLTVKSSSAGTREFAIAGLQVRKRDAPNVASDNHLQTKTLAKPSVSARTVTLGLLGGQHLPKQTLQTSDRHAIDARVPESSRQNYRPVAVTPEKKGSWIDSKAFAVSVWIVIPLIILIVILGLVLGLKG